MKFATKITKPTNATYRELLFHSSGEKSGGGEGVRGEVPLPELCHTMNASNYFNIIVLKRRKRRKKREVGRYTEKRDEKKIWNFCNTIGKEFKFIICTSCAKGFLVEGLFPLFTPPLRFWFYLRNNEYGPIVS